MYLTWPDLDPTLIEHFYILLKYVSNDALE